MSLIFALSLSSLFLLVTSICIIIVRTELVKQMEHSRTVNQYLKNPNYKYSPKITSLSGILFMRIYTFLKNMIY